MKFTRTARRGRLGTLAALALLVAAVTLAAPAAASEDDLAADAVVEVIVADRAELDALVATGVDLTHQVGRRGGSLVAQAVVTQEELASLREAGFRVGQTLWTQADTDARNAERLATIEAKRQANRSLRARSFQAAADTDTLIVLRSDWFTTVDAPDNDPEQFLYVEVKSQPRLDHELVPDADAQLGQRPGHRPSAPAARSRCPASSTPACTCSIRNLFKLTTRPSQIRSRAGGRRDRADVSDWLRATYAADRQDPGYQRTSSTTTRRRSSSTRASSRSRSSTRTSRRSSSCRTRRTATSARRRRRSAAPGRRAAVVVYLGAAWGHEGGNDITVEFVNRARRDLPLSVVVTRQGAPRAPRDERSGRAREHGRPGRARRCEAGRAGR